MLTIPGVWGRLAIMSHFCRSRFQVVCHRLSNWVQRCTHSLGTQWGCPGLSVMPPASRLRAAPRAHCPQLVSLSSWCFLPRGHRGPRPLRFHTRVPSGKGKAGLSQVLPGDAALCFCPEANPWPLLPETHFHFPTSRPGGDRGGVVGNSCGLASSRSSPEATAPLWSERLGVETAGTGYEGALVWMGREDKTMLTGASADLAQGESHWVLKPGGGCQDRIHIRERWLWPLPGGRLGGLD